MAVISAYSLWAIFSWEMVSFLDRFGKRPSNKHLSKQISHQISLKKRTSISLYSIEKEYNGAFKVNFGK